MNKEKAKYLLNRTRELLDAMKLVYEMESRDQSQNKTMNGFSSFKTFATQLKVLATDVHEEFSDSIFFTYNIELMKGPFNSLYMHRKEIFDASFIEAGKIKAFLESKLGEEYEETSKILNLITKRLRSTIREIPKKEIEIQDKIEDLFSANGYKRGTDFDRETGRVKTGLKESVPDFIFRNLNFCIEVKLIKDREGTKKIIEQINADKTSYGTEYENILFVVYDAGGFIRNEDEFKYNIIEKNILLEIVKH
jgi:hypothetical protein